MRVQIPAYTDRWMMGDRYGEVIGTYKRKRSLHPDETITVARVKLDKSGKIISAVLDDCEVL